MALWQEIIKKVENALAQKVIKKAIEEFKRNG